MPEQGRPFSDVYDWGRAPGRHQPWSTTPLLDLIEALRKVYDPSVMQGDQAMRLPRPETGDRGMDTAEDDLFKAPFRADEQQEREIEISAPSLERNPLELLWRIFQILQSQQGQRPQERRL